MTVDEYIRTSVDEEIGKNGISEGFSIGLNEAEFEGVKLYVGERLNRLDILNKQSFYIRIHNMRVNIFKVETIL